MKPTSTRLFVALTLASVPCLQALAQPAAPASDARKGDHPAVVVKRLQAQQGYDYAGKFYPHPAWLYLYLEAPAAPVDAQARIDRLPRPTPEAAAAATTALVRTDVE